MASRSVSAAAAASLGDAWKAWTTGDHQTSNATQFEFPNGKARMPRVIGTVKKHSCVNSVELLALSPVVGGHTVPDTHKTNNMVWHSLSPVVGDHTFDTPPDSA